MSQVAVFYCAVLFSTEVTLTCNLIIKQNANNHLEKCEACYSLLKYVQRKHGAGFNEKSTLMTVSREGESIMLYRVAWRPEEQDTLYKELEEWISGNLSKLLNGTQSVGKLKRKSTEQ